MEDRVVVEAVLGERDERRGGLRRALDVERDDEVAARRGERQRPRLRGSSGSVGCVSPPSSRGLGRLDVAAPGGRCRRLRLRARRRRRSRRRRRRRSRPPRGRAGRPGAGGRRGAARAEGSRPARRGSCASGTACTVPVTIEVNGERHTLEVEPTRRLLGVLRDELALTGAKLGCGEGACGACAVLLDGAPAVSCLLPVGAVEGRSVTTIEGLARARGAPAGAVRRRGRPPVRLLHARPDRLGDRPARGDAGPDARRDPGGDGGQHLPLRRVSQDRARDPRRLGPGGRVTKRFVKTQREMEGRFEDVWALVDEEDDLEIWPDDAELSVVGRPAPRQDGPSRASGAARYTVDVALPGMLDARVLRAPTARCRVTSLDLDAARATPGVRAVLGPDGPFTMSGPPVLTAEPSWAGEPVAAVAADTPQAAEAALAALAPAYETGRAARRRLGSRPAAVHGRPARARARRARRRRSRPPRCASRSPARRPRTCRPRSSRTPRSRSGTATS